MLGLAACTLECHDLFNALQLREAEVRHEAGCVPLLPASPLVTTPPAAQVCNHLLVVALVLLETLLQG